MNAGTRERLDATARRNGGVAARRALIRWAWRLFRHEWRQQSLMVALITVAVAATIVGVAVADNAPSSANAATFGSANELLTLPGSDSHLTADVAAVRQRFGAIEVIENQTAAIPGTVQSVQLRAQDPHGRYGQPMLALVSGHYPTGADEVSVSGGVASLLDLRIGERWNLGGHLRRVVGLVEDPANLLDKFALVPPGQVGAPTEVTVLFDADPANVAGFHVPGGATPKTRDNRTSPAGIPYQISPAAAVLMVAVLGLILVGLVAMAGFTVIAQRRLRSLGMLSAVGATDRHIRLVMLANGTLVGVVGTLIGAALGFLAWIAYAPHLQTSVEHRIEWSNVPWWAIASAMVLAIVTATVAAWRPARAAAQIAVVAALSGRPTPPKASHRAAIPGIATLAAGLGCLASAGGWAGRGESNTLLLAAGIVATAVGTLLLAPLAAAVPMVVASRTPVAVRLALRDLGRYRARSGAALAATSFAVLLAVVISILATARSSDPLAYTGPNLAENQLIVYEPHGPGSGYTGLGTQPTPTQLRTLQARVRALAASFHARFILPLQSAGRPNPAPDTITFGTNQRATLWQARGPHGPMTRAQALHADRDNYEGALYVATPALLRDYSIKPSQIDPATDILTSRARLADVPHLELLGQGDVVSHYTTDGQLISEDYRCPPASCIRNPKIQTLTSLPTGTSAPNTLITEHAAHTLRQQLVPDGWLIQTTDPLTPAEKNGARQLALATETHTETASGKPDLSEIRTWATAAGIILTLAVLTMTVGLIRAEAASDLRTLTATGASSITRRTLTAATAGTIALLGAVLGTTAAYLAVTAWAHTSLGTTLSPAPVGGLIVILVGLPVAATSAGWLLAGREPSVIARRPLE